MFSAPCPRKQFSSGAAACGAQAIGDFDVSLHFRVRVRHALKSEHHHWLFLSMRRGRLPRDHSRLAEKHQEGSGGQTCGSQNSFVTIRQSFYYKMQIPIREHVRLVVFVQLRSLHMLFVGPLPRQRRLDDASFQIGRYLCTAMASSNTNHHSHALLETAWSGFVLGSKLPHVARPRHDSSAHTCGRAAKGPILITRMQYRPTSLEKFRAASFFFFFGANLKPPTQKCRCKLQVMFWNCILRAIFLAVQ